MRLLARKNVAVGLIVNSSPVYTSETPEELVASRVGTHDCLQGEALSLEKCKGDEEDQQDEAVRAIPGSEPRLLPIILDFYFLENHL